MRLSLQNRLVILSVAITAVAMLTVGGINYLSTRSHTTSLLQSQALHLAQAQAATLAQWMSNKSQVVSALKPYALTSNIEDHLKMAAQGGQFDQTFVGFPDKRALFSEQRQRAADYDPTTRTWYKGAVAAGGPYVSAPYIGASTGKMLITFSDVVGAGSAVEAVVAGDVMMESVIAAISAIRPTAHSYAFLVGGDGSLIAHPDSAMTLKPLSTLHPQLTMTALEQGGQTWLLGTREGLLFSQPVPGSSWRLAVVMDREESMTALTTMATSSLLSTIVACALAGALLMWVIRRMLQRLTTIRHAISAAGKGDFTQRLPVQGDDELTQIATAYNRFADSIAEVLQRMRGTSGSVEIAASEIAAGNQDLSERTEQQATALAHTVESVDKLTQNVQLNAEHASRANDLARSASAVAHKGGTVVSGVVDMMGAINTSSRKIADIIGVIDSIAFQTNILALNAAVEAARAGEQGRGFAVVAGEVRSLAQRSAEAAREISALINDSVNKVDNGSALVQQAGQTMQAIVDSVQRVTGIMGEISQATQAQSSEIAQINQAVLSMESGTQQNTALVEEAAAAAESLREQATALAHMVNGFQLQDTGVARSHRAATPRLALEAA